MSFPYSLYLTPTHLISLDRVQEVEFQHDSCLVSYHDGPVIRLTLSEGREFLKAYDHVYQHYIVRKVP